MNNSEVLEKLRAYLKCQENKVKGINALCNHNLCDDCDLCYMQGTTGEHIEAIEVATQALEKLKDNESGCRCNSSQTNAEKIRSMSDEELAEFMQKMECSCFVDFIGYADKGCGRNEISCKDCRAKAPTIFEWLQSKTE